MSGEDSGMATLLARNAEVLVTMDGKRRELKNAGLYAEDGIIKMVGTSAELPATADTVIDLKDISWSRLVAIRGDNRCRRLCTDDGQPRAAGLLVRARRRPQTCRTLSIRVSLI